MDQVCNLTCTMPTSPVPVPIHVVQKNMVMVALAQFHHASRKIRKSMDPMSVSQQGFNTFCVEECGTEKNIVIWRTPQPDVKLLIHGDEHIKPNIKAFTPYKDEAHWICGKERFITTVAAQGLNHLDGHVFAIHWVKADSALFGFIRLFCSALFSFIRHNNFIQLYSSFFGKIWLQIHLYSAIFGLYCFTIAIFGFILQNLA
jgi:hypothetical protein